MSKVVSPYPALRPDPARLPDARWWRIESYGRDEHGHLYVVTHNGDLAAGRGPLQWPGATFVTVEWFDGHSTVFDAGFDAINTVGLVVKSCGTHVAVDLLMESQPTPDAVPMTIPGDREHPDDVGKSSERQWF